VAALIYQLSALPAAWRDFVVSPDLEVSVSHGEIFTRPWVVDLILDLAGYTADRDLAALRAVEPACGSGAFVVPMARRVSESCRRHGRPIADAGEAIDAVDLNADHVESTRAAVVETLTELGWGAVDAGTLAERWVRQGDFIVGSDLGGTADFVLGNPPYVRPEDIAPKRLRLYRQACPTMGGRADLFIAFFETGLRALNAGGTLGFICADRWMHNQYGGRLRAMIGEHFSIEATVVMHDVDAFEENVSAYPAVTIIRRREQRRCVVADTTQAFGAADAALLVRWAKGPRSTPKSTGGFEAAALGQWFKGSEGWPSGRPARVTLIADLEKRFPRLEDAHKRTRVRIGVATGADPIFVTSDADLVEPDRLLPLSMVQDLKSDRFEWSGHYLVDPWAAEDPAARRDRFGGLVDLDRYPRLRAYFDANHAALAGRKRTLANGTVWYATIDRVDHSVTARPKLLFPDMRLTSRPVYDSGGFYPHHNLYYVVSDHWPLEILGGLLLSEVADMFIGTYAVKMRGKTARFQAQYLRRICVPVFDTIGEADRTALADAFSARDVERATGVALGLYGVSQATLDAAR
jgi:adenine-specific DNA-methyltransferase